MPSPEVLAWLLIAIINAYTAWMGWKTNKMATQTAVDIRKVEIATNSMKDALVKATAVASHAEGHEEARLEGEQKAATLAEGRLKGPQDLQRL